MIMKEMRMYSIILEEDAILPMIPMIPMIPVLRLGYGALYSATTLNRTDQREVLLQASAKG